jgi:hypothetical protein
VGYQLVTAATGLTTDQNNHFALFSYSGGTLTKVAESLNVTDGSLWTGTLGYRSVAFSSTYEDAPEGLYYVAWIYNQSAGTAPFIGAASVTTGHLEDMSFTNSATFIRIASGTSIPSSTTMGALTNEDDRFWITLEKP